VTSLKYARVERERRWLLAALPDVPPDARRLRIVDLYIRGTRLRLREVTEEGAVTRKLGHKVRLGVDATEVAHTSLYLDNAEWELLVTLPADVLRKTRTLIPHDGTTVAVDVFEGGLVLAEIDHREGPARELPPSYDVVREVTGDERYTGGALARAGRPPDGIPA
jgi:CYTH domain-containing protein